MDHIPTPSHPAYSRLEVPYLLDNLSPPYTFQGQWTDFPQHKGYSKQAILQHGNFEEKLEGGEQPEDNQHIAKFFQEWLYFGLLREILGPDVDLTLFISSSGTSHHSTITTSYLAQILQTWSSKILTTLSPDAQFTRLLSIDIVLFEAQSFVASCLAQGGRHTSRLCPDPVSYELGLSITALCVALMHAKRVVFEKIGGGKRFQFGQSPFVMQRLINDNEWCPSDARNLSMRMTIAGMWVAGLLGKRAVERDHGKCGEGECLAIKIDEDKYKTLHTKEGCKCEFLNVDAEIAEKILLHGQGGWPVVRFFPEDSGSDSSEDTGQGSIEVVSSNDVEEYVAISHVWADGLGNTKANSLPLCQLKRIQGYVDQQQRWITGSSHPDPGPAPKAEPEEGFDPAKPRPKTPPKPRIAYFWLDTLCIPLTPAIRRLAIQRMRDTYATAASVLVLDSDIVHYPSQNASYNEIFMRVAIAIWMRRLWTLQEGVLAKTLWFQFSDDSVNAEVVRDRVIRDTGRVRLTQNVPFEIVSLFHGLWQVKEVGAKQPEERIKYLWNAAQGRSTSNPLDEAVCFGTALGFDEQKMKGVTGTEEDREMRVLRKEKRLTPEKEAELEISKLKRLIGLQEWWPSDFVFLRGPRLTDNGFRWFPRSFLFRGQGGGVSVVENHIILLSLPLGRWIPGEGLLVKFFGMKMSFKKDVALEEIFWATREDEDEGGKGKGKESEKQDVTTAMGNLDIETGDKPSSSAPPPRKASRRWYRIHDSRGPEDPRPWSSFAVHKLSNPAILTSLPLTSPLTGAIGIIVDITKDADGVIYARYHSRVWIGIEEEKRYEILEGWWGWKDQNGENQHLSKLAGCWTLGEGQQWCIG